MAEHNLAVKEVSESLQEIMSQILAETNSVKDNGGSKVNRKLTGRTKLSCKAITTMTK